VGRKSSGNFLRGLREKGGLIFIPVSLFAFVAPGEAVKAEEPAAGVQYWTYESFGGSPELPTDESVVLSSGTVPSINLDWGGGQVLDSGRHDGVIVRFEGWLTAPTLETYYICAFTDDGFQLFLDDQLVIPDWWDRGPSCGNTADVDFSDGLPKRLLAYYYENGGGAMAQLRYYTGEGMWDPIPESWYFQSDPTPTTTTTTTEAPTTTVEETTTTTIPIEESTTIPELTTTIPVPVVVPPQPTAPQPETTQPAPSQTSLPPQSSPAPSIPSEPSPAPSNPQTNTQAPIETEKPTNESEQPAKDSEPEAPEEPVSEPEADQETEEETSQPSVSIANETQNAREALSSVLQSGSLANLSTEQIRSIFNPSVLESLTGDEVSQLIASINVSELTQEQAEALSAALSSAPDNVKAEFETQINVFNGTFDSYVPKGSTISVGQRRLIVAVTCVVFAMPAPAVSRSRGV
jgi:hypothetical protein